MLRIYETEAFSVPEVALVPGAFTNADCTAQARRSTAIFLLTSI